MQKVIELKSECSCWRISGLYLKVYLRDTPSLFLCIQCPDVTVCLLVRRWLSTGLILLAWRITMIRTIYTKIYRRKVICNDNVKNKEILRKLFIRTLKSLASTICRFVTRREVSTQAFLTGPRKSWLHWCCLHWCEFMIKSLNYSYTNYKYKAINFDNFCVQKRALRRRELQSSPKCLHKAQQQISGPWFMTISAILSSCWMNRTKMIQ